MFNLCNVGNFKFPDVIQPFCCPYMMQFSAWGDGAMYAALNNQYGNNVHGAQPTSLENFSNLTEKSKKFQVEKSESRLG